MNRYLRNLITVVAIISSCAANASAQYISAQTPREPRLISVSGNAEVKVVPDEVNFSLGIETRDRDLRIAKSQNDNLVEKVLAFAKGYGIDSKHIQTDYISIDPHHDSLGNSITVDFYIVYKSIAIILRDVSKFEGLLSGVVEAGVNHVKGIEFRTSELRKHRDQARTMAIKAAQEKATALAAELGLKVRKAYSIQESSYGWYGGFGVNARMDTGGRSEPSETSIALGQISITAVVSVSFELE